ncbi:hypothetical protein CRUP_025648 [Coryphaenoides rupestris]|nr:hypothetical protein CRUP_025648 [Coryphaenoides rupestris]
MNFSIDRILSLDFPHPAEPSALKTTGGPCYPPHPPPPPGGVYLYRPPGGLCSGPGCCCCASCYGLLYPAELTFHPAELTSDHRQTARDTGERRPQVSRVRTVFTGSQTAELERLFRCTEYPPAAARAALAQNTRLPEETVWFKNRRARRKRQRTGGPPAP